MHVSIRTRPVVGISLVPALAATAARTGVRAACVAPSLSSSSESRRRSREGPELQVLVRLMRTRATREYASRPGEGSVNTVRRWRASKHSRSLSACSPHRPSRLSDGWRKPARPRRRRRATSSRWNLRPTFYARGLLALRCVQISLVLARLSRLCCCRPSAARVREAAAAAEAKAAAQRRSLSGSRAVQRRRRGVRGAGAR